MFWFAVKDKELFFSRSVLCINLFCFLSLNRMCICSYLLTYFALMKEKPCLWGTSVIEVLQRRGSYNQPMLNTSYFQNSPPSSGLLTNFCKADIWLVSIAAADCHPLSLKLKVLLWCGGRGFLGRWKIARWRQQCQMEYVRNLWEQGHPDPQWRPQKTTRDTVLQMWTSNQKESGPQLPKLFSTFRLEPGK